MPGVAAVLGDEVKRDTGQNTAVKEGADNTYDERRGKTFDRAGAEKQENHAGDDRSEVGVEDSREGVAVTFGNSPTQLLPLL